MYEVELRREGLGGLSETKGPNDHYVVSNVPSTGVLTGFCSTLTTGQFPLS